MIAPEKLLSIMSQHTFTIELLVIPGFRHGVRFKGKEEVFLYFFFFFLVGICTLGWEQ